MNVLACYQLVGRGKYIQERSDEGKETSGRLFRPDSIVRDALIGLRRGTLASSREDFVNLRALAVWVLGNDTCHIL